MNSLALADDRGHLCVNFGRYGCWRLQHSLPVRIKACLDG